eukprot:CAMPEP_0206525086 /NCGR_PEP_ID=MMETSP0324_2-20121206/68542_1 /ASSEMBLY_ACC=CAM_ASM_000836 /TAXON_ID=2866 /ORGANISM="Crypthecodinium cohnii, Strain Seligo" /LENGTH=131 /DNA_ID=CAMNT_0054019721 /DNA_START=964 /DNA_END=1357 /DNA_ORIENTATION=-
MPEVCQVENAIDEDFDGFCFVFSVADIIGIIVVAVVVAICAAFVVASVAAAATVVGGGSGGGGEEDEDEEEVWSCRNRSSSSLGRMSATLLSFVDMYKSATRSLPVAQRRIPKPPKIQQEYGWPRGPLWLS